MLDGLSMGNSGLYQPVTPTELVSQAERSAKDSAEEIIKELQKGEKSKLDKENKDEDENQKSNADGRYTESESDGQQQEQGPNDQLIDNKKKYKVKFNNLTDMVELVDYNTGYIVETIAPDDLLNIISKSKNLSGILVDRQI